MQSLEAACEKAEHIIHIATRKPSSVQHIQERNGSTFISIHQKLRELYEEESALNSIPELKHLNPSSFLLSKLVEKEKLNTLVVNLYPGNRGYSLMVRSRSTPTTKGVGEGVAEVEDHGVLEVETSPLPYEDDELLRYLDNEELPQPLAELLEKTEGCGKKGSNSYFYSGCVVAEVRDYRLPPGHPGNLTEPESSPSPGFSQPSICRTHHVLLRPTTQSILGDVGSLTSGGGWNAEERLALESQLVLATQGPLCLDPSPSVSVVANRLHRHHTLLSSESLVRRARKFSWASMNRKRKLDQTPVPPGLPLQEFLAQRKSKSHNVPAPSAKLVKQLVEDTVEVPLVVPSPPPSVDVLRFARAYERPRETNDCSPQLVEEYVLEAEKGGSGPGSSQSGRVYHIQLTILQRPSNGEYLGELYVDRDYRKGVQNGASCRFSLGTRAHANRYIQQFTEIFTEEGRKSVRISHTVPGQCPRVTCTSGMREREAKAAAAAAAAAAATAAAASASATAAVAVATPVLPNAMVPGAAATTPVAPIAPSAATGSPNTNLILSNGTPNTVVVQRPLRQEVVQPAAPSQNKQVSSPWPGTNPAISALVTSLMNSAIQFQRANAAEASNNSSTCSPPRPAPARTITSQPVAVPVQKTPGRKTNIIPHNSRSQNATHVNASQTHRPRQQPPPGVSRVQASSPLLASQLCSPPVLSSPPQLLASPLAPSATTTSPFNAPERVTPPCISRPAPDPSPVISSEGSSTSASSSAGLSVPGLSALLAGTPSADNPIPGINSGSSLLERLTASSSGGTCPPAQNSLPVAQNTLPQVTRGTRVQVPPPAVPIPAPPPPPPGPGPGVTLANLNLQSLGLTGIPGLQNVQVSIPGLAVPISLSLNVSAAGGSAGVTAAPTGVLVATTGAGALTRAPPPLTHNSVTSMGTSTITAATAVAATSSQVMAGGAVPTTMVLTNATGGIGSQGSVLSLPVAQIVTSGVKGHGQQGIRTATSTVSLPQVAGTLHKPRAGIIGGAVGSPAKMGSRGVLEPGIPYAAASLRMAVASGPSSGGVPGGSPSGAVSPSVALPIIPQHQLQMALLKQTEQLQCRAQQHQQVGTGKPAVAAAKHRRRPSNTPSTVTAVTSVDPKQ